MRRLCPILALLLALALPGIATAGTQPGVGRWNAMTTRHRLLSCGRRKPTSLTFTRRDGQAVGTLSWKPGRGAPRRARYRVVRNGKVIGETRRHFMRVNVRLGSRYKLSVRLIYTNGKAARCGTELTVSTVYRLPSTPTWLSVSGASGPKVTLLWRPSLRGDARVVGYRLLRTGAVYGQTRATSMSVPIASNRRYVFTVVAVDNRGRLSLPSAPVVVQAGHSPPPAPTGLQGGALSDTSVALSWQPSQPARGRLVGYRVLRNGTPVGQYGATSVQLTNLAASTTYTFSVLAVDGLGYLSPPATVTVRTANPTPTSGHAFAFVLASTDQSFHDFEAHYQQIGTISPSYYDCDAAAHMTGGNDLLITGWAQARQVRVLPRFNCQRSAVLDSLLTNPTLRQQWLDGIMAQVNAGGYDGATLDFEAGYATDRDAYSLFVADLAARLHAEGKTLALAVSAKTADVPNHPRSTFFDYNALSAQADTLVVMCWGIHWATSAPGAQDDMSWVRQVVGYIATLPRTNKYVLGMQLYAMDWANGGGSANPATSYEYQDAVNLAAQVGATPRYDAASDALTFSYTDASGAHHDVWYTDATTEANRMTLAKNNGLGGIAFWRLGREDQRLWSNPLLSASY
jgi:spore germination protein YaaH